MTDTASSNTKTGRPKLALALQGGGAHGAYGWGVLERVLAENIEVVAVSGASAGALNGAALVAGLVEGGTPGALAGLERLWHTVCRQSPLRALDLGGWSEPLVEPVLRRSLEIGKLVGPYIAPFAPHLRDMRPLRRVVSTAIDLEALARSGALPLHISATKVANGAARLFTNAEITLDALMASACLPDLFAAVEIEGEAYWDGGFSANPALEPLIFNGYGATDVLVIQITPFADEDISSSLTGIMARMNDINFNSCLMRDLKALTEVQAIARDTASSAEKMKVLAATNLHLMEASPELAKRGPGGKFDTRRSQIEALRELGRETADAWLADHRHAFGSTSTLTELPESAAA